jgi:transcriptional regulator with XRE-family HTH domain
MSDSAKMTGRQIAAGRALARMEQAELAKAANISVPTLRRMEASDGPVRGMPNNVAAIRSALEAAGVIFVDENGEGPGVRLKKVRQDTAAPTTIPLDELNAENDE